MTGISNDLLQRLKTLMGDLDFSWDAEALDSPERFMAYGKRISQELERLADMGPEKEERVNDLMRRLFALMLQSAAVEKFGDSSISSIRKLLEEVYDAPNVKDDIIRLRNTAEQAFRSILTQEQYETIMKRASDDFPASLVDWFTDFYGPYQNLPLAESASVSKVLSDMMKEVANGDA